MQSEIDWTQRIDMDEDDGAGERYKYFMVPEPKEDLGPIEEIDDPYLGHTKIRQMTVGMVRNAKPENKKTVTAYLLPFPHTRVSKAKDLQGWYQAKNNIDPVTGKAHRPRPCMSDSLLTEPWGGYCPIGCGFSLPAGELVDTPKGPKAIDGFKIGDEVWGKSAAGEVVATKVIGLSEHIKKEGYIHLKTGNLKLLKLTADHPVYSSLCKSWRRADQVVLVQTIEGGETTAEVAGGSPDECIVYDIETETGNFYQRGILVHNCYINSGMRGYRGTGLVTVPIDYGPQIGKQLSKLHRAAAGYFSSFTDPFLELEDYYHNTEQAAEEFVKVGLPIYFLSRKKYPDWAIKLLQINPHSYAQKSINTCDPEDWRYLSPGALPLMDHMEDIRKLKKAGIYVSIQCNPIIPGVTSNSQIVKLFKMLADAGADHVIVKFVEAGYSWAPAMVAKMVKRFGERGTLFESLFDQNIGGQRTVNEEYRLSAHRLYSSYARRYGLTYSVCYEYKYARDPVSGEIIDKTGVSIGREFLTAAQCHGHAVPIYVRENLADNFRPLDECPPSGCLHCADDNGGEPRCGDETMGQAKALRLVDLKLAWNPNHGE